MATPDSNMGDLSSSSRRRVVFDWTINLGHILTFISFLGIGIGIYTSLDKRVTVVEQAAIYQIKRDETQDQVIKDGKNEIRDALKDVHFSIDKLSDKLDAARIRR